MNRKIIVLLITMALAMSALSIGTAAAKTTTNNIEFTLDGWADTTDPLTNTFNTVSVSAVFDGNIQDKNGAYYLQPLTGVITIDGEEHQIQIKQPKQSEPVYYDEIIDSFYIDACFNLQFELQNWMTFSEVNIDGHKYIGDLNWYQISIFGIFDCEPIDDSEGRTELSFRGIIDGKRMTFMLDGDYPVIN